MNVCLLTLDIGDTYIRIVSDLIGAEQKYNEENKKNIMRYL